MGSLFTGELFDKISVRLNPSSVSLRTHLTLRAALESHDQCQRINRDRPRHSQP